MNIDTVCVQFCIIDINENKFQITNIEEEMQSIDAQDLFRLNVKQFHIKTLSHYRSIFCLILKQF